MTRALRAAVHVDVCSGSVADQRHWPRRLGALAHGPFLDDIGVPTRATAASKPGRRAGESSRAGLLAA